VEVRSTLRRLVFNSECYVVRQECCDGKCVRERGHEVTGEWIVKYTNVNVALALLLDLICGAGKPGQRLATPRAQRFITNARFSSV
jgi:hypothetical protein